METREYVVALRDLADWYEAHPEAPVPSDRRFYAWGSTLEQVRSVVRASGGEWTKRFSGDMLYMEQTFGCITLALPVLRAAVCTQRVVDYEDVPEEYRPAHRRAIIEWDCHDPLLAPDGERPTEAPRDSQDEPPTQDGEQPPSWTPDEAHQGEPTRLETSEPA